MIAPRTARADFSRVKKYGKLFVMTLVSAVLVGCGNSHVCAFDTLNVSPQNAVADHSAPTPANSQPFLAFGYGLPAGCSATQSNLINVIWSVSDPIDVSISNMQGNTFGTASCINSTAVPVTITATLPASANHDKSASGIATLTCN
jgi:hypothetical protein